MGTSRETGPRCKSENGTSGYSGPFGRLDFPPVKISPMRHSFPFFFFFFICLVHAACRRRAIALIIFAVRYREVSPGRPRSRSQTQSQLIYLVRVLFFVGRQTRDFFSRRTSEWGENAPLPRGSRDLKKKFPCELPALPCEFDSCDRV